MDGGLAKPRFDALFQICSILVPPGRCAELPGRSLFDELDPVPQAIPAPWRASGRPQIERAPVVCHGDFPALTRVGRKVRLEDLLEGGSKRQVATR